MLTLQGRKKCVPMSVPNFFHPFLCKVFLPNTIIMFSAWFIFFTFRKEECADPFHPGHSMQTVKIADQPQHGPANLATSCYHVSTSHSGLPPTTWHAFVRLLSLSENGSGRLCKIWTLCRRVSIYYFLLQWGLLWQVFTNLTINLRKQTVRRWMDGMDISF